MIKPEKPHDEALRQEALMRYRILDTGREHSFDDLVAIAKTICGASMGAVSLIDGERQWFKAIVGIDAEENDRETSFCGHAILQPQQVMVVEDAQRDVRFHDNPVVVDDPHIRFYAGAPLLSQDGFALGTLCVFDSSPGQLDEEQTQAMAALSRQVSLVMELRRFALEVQQHMLQRQGYEQQLTDYNLLLEQQNADLSEQSRTDVLTGLPNRRAMSAALQAAVTDADGQPRVTAVALLDIDHFKSINDIHGHAAGDRVLTELGGLLRAHFSGRGLAARYGGEEFVVLMPDTGMDIARLQCEFLRMAVMDMPLGIPLTVSIGVAVHCHGDNVEATLARADAALYRAKAEGRNQVRAAD